MTKPKRFLCTIAHLFTRSKEGREEEDLQEIAAKEQKIFRYEALAAATHNFDAKQRLGEGGFGPVFKGKLGDGREVAVKQLAKGSRQGEKEFINEANLLSRVQHRNVVNLYGYCAHGDEKMLVYEYVPNESLDKFLFSSDDNMKKMQLDWNRRYSVMIGVARGLLYLHEDAHTPIIHRDIKASNILLDERWVPKIADFGMARLYPEDQTHVNTRVAGTNGYMAPEYLMHGNLSTKADVYSFGVVILELISGRKNNGFMPLPDPEVNCVLEWAYKLFKKGQSLEMMDPVLASSADREQVALCIHIGLLCAQADPKLRPDMKRLVLILSKKTSALEEPMKPGLPGSRYRRKTHGGRSSYSTGESSSSTNKASTVASTATNSAATNTTTRSTTNQISPRPIVHGKTYGVRSSYSTGESSSSTNKASTVASTATNSAATNTTTTNQINPRPIVQGKRSIQT